MKTQTNSYYQVSVKNYIQVRPQNIQPGPPYQPPPTRVIPKNEKIPQIIHDKSEIVSISQILNPNRGELLKCSKCEKQLDSNLDVQKIFYVDRCYHLYCKMCLGKEIQDNYVNKNGIIQCYCSAKLDNIEIEQIIGKPRFDALNQKLIEKNYNIVECGSCQDKFEFEVGKNQEVNLKDPKTQQPLSKYLIDHYVQNRFTCLNNVCKKEQCKNCKTIPYHLGMTCDQMKIKKSQKRCRYCDNPIDDQNAKEKQCVCHRQECKDKAQFACKKTLGCGHECYGFINEQKCLPCLHEDCQHLMKTDQKGEDYCNICFVEALNQAPCIQTSCNHIIHCQCLIKILEVRWNGPRINFNFCLCPLCKQWMEFQPGSEAQKILKKFQNLLEDVQKKSQERLKYEGKDKDERLKNPEDNYYQKPLQYSLAIYCYYECFKCQKPYFGGAKDCQRAMEDDNKAFNPAELVCGNCCQVDASEQCSIHGNDYIEFKCKFCCNMSVWFCWGSTHFCDECHKKQCNNDWVSKYPKDKLPKCLGNEKCPIGGAHKANGDECALGCTLCRNNKANIKQF